MKFRIAKKIWKAIGEEGDHRYSESQKNAACNRMERLKSSRRNKEFWLDLVGNRMTVLDRAYILPPSMALKLLMQTKEADWNKTANEILNANQNLQTWKFQGTERSKAPTSNRIRYLGGIESI